MPAFNHQSLCPALVASNAGRRVGSTSQAAAPARRAALRLVLDQERLRKRIDFGVTSTSSSSSMNSTAYFEREFHRRRQQDVLVLAGRAYVGELLFLDRVDDQVVISAGIPTSMPSYTMSPGDTNRRPRSCSENSE